MSRVAIIDYGMGNLHSVSKAIEHVAPGNDVQVTADHNLIRSADRVILPGVGAMRDCMAEMKKLGIDSLVNEVSADRPFLGICVGMQALMAFSEENNGVDCLGLFNGKVRFFGKHLVDESTQPATKLKIPHMGWNEVKQSPHPLWQNIKDASRFYFVHSYYVDATEETALKDFIVGETQYGKQIASVIARQNVFATQFHPEKSQHDGLQLLKNFMNWNGQL
jgi:glutamine amidotransferase